MSDTRWQKQGLEAAAADWHLAAAAGAEPNSAATRSTGPCCRSIAEATTRNHTCDHDCPLCCHDSSAASCNALRFRAVVPVVECTSTVFPQHPHRLPCTTNLLPLPNASNASANQPTNLFTSYRRCHCWLCQNVGAVMLSNTHRFPAPACPRALERRRWRQPTAVKPKFHHGALISTHSAGNSNIAPCHAVCTYR